MEHGSEVQAMDLLVILDRQREKRASKDDMGSITGVVKSNAHTDDGGRYYTLMLSYQEHEIRDLRMVILGMVTLVLVVVHHHLNARRTSVNPR